MIKKTLSNRPNTDNELAERWQCTVRTIRRWRKEGAPFHDDRKMFTWLATRQKLPPGTAGLVEANRIEGRRDVAANYSGLVEGAPEALKRLASAEARAFASFEAAVKSGDLHETKAARENWLRISESLRRYDLQIEQSRRSSGELIAREQVEELLRMFGHAIIGALYGFEDVTRLAVFQEEPGVIHAAMGAAFQNLSFSAMSAVRSQTKLPRWAIDAFCHATQLAPYPEESYAAMAAFCAELVKHQGSEMAKAYLKKVDAQKRYYEATDPAEKARIWHTELHPQELR